MKAFFVGLLVIVLTSLFSLVALLLFPLIIVLGFLLKAVIGVIFLLFAIWLIGKLTLLLLDYLNKKEPPTLPVP